MLKNISRGKAPGTLSASISGAPLTALNKKSAGVRPIAVEETHRHFLCSILMTRVSKKSQLHL